MTVTQLAPGECPACRSTLSAPLSDGTRLCGECGHEWDPREVTAPLVETPIAPPAPTPPTLVIAPEPPTFDDPAAMIEQARAAYVGRQAVHHELEQTGTITEVDESGYALIEFASGFYVIADPDEFSLVETAEIGDDVVAAIGSTEITVAAQVLRAGAAAINEADNDRTVGMAPEDWLPREIDALPVIEHGVSYAIAYLAVQWGVSVQQLNDIAQMLDNAAEAAREATGQ